MERPAADRSIAELLSDLSEQTVRLVRTEARLAAREMTGKARRGALGGGTLAAAAAIVGYAGVALLAAAVLALATVMPAWASALLVGIGLLLVAIPVALVGRALMRRALPPVPQDTLARVREDIDMVKERADK
ncbi:MAG TPA: phage holin family protein [Actinophytocola sp.]|uniref:phage holin family protein n=1 Tax=Actinophytocola sp. TaxID=1872138 RepID=UPI002DB8EB76|nr:phage holin family protein [Actinophytocola sp.]HEU5472572.1 phage holin family protein [Actinophytocola sp.]